MATAASCWKRAAASSRERVAATAASRGRASASVESSRGREWAIRDSALIFQGGG